MRLSTCVLICSVVARAASAQSAIETRQRDGSAALLKSRTAHQANNAADAVKWGERAVSLLPDSANAHLWLGRAYLLELEDAAFYRLLGLSKRARSAFDHAVALDSNNFDVRDARARYYMNAPSIGGGSIEKARAEADVARRINPYRGALLRGQIEENEKQAGAAEAEYSALVRAYPDSATPFNRLVNLYQTSRQFAEAFRLIDARSARFPADEAAMYQAGKTAALSGERLEKGEAAIRQFIAAGKFILATEANARHRLGMILEKRKDAEGARREYETAVRLDPKLDDAKAGLKRVQSR